MRVRGNIVIVYEQVDFHFYHGNFYPLLYSVLVTTLLASFSSFLKFSLHPSFEVLEMELARSQNSVGMSSATSALFEHKNS